jgi:hypothetical protein
MYRGVLRLCSWLLLSWPCLHATLRVMILFTLCACPHNLAHHNPL